MSLTPQTPEEHEIIDAFRKMDDIQALIFMTGIDAVRAGQITTAQFYDWTRERFDRYAAGEDLTLDDLALPPHDPNWVSQWTLQ